jgi:hypothetical protein
MVFLQNFIGNNGKLQVLEFGLVEKQGRRLGRTGVEFGDSFTIISGVKEPGSPLTDLLRPA